MQVKAAAKHIRMSPSKVRLVANLIRGMEIKPAMDQLRFSSKLAKKPIMKLVDSAVANALHNFDIKKENLFVKEIRVDEAKKLYRWMPKAHGRATKIRKRSCHISLILQELVDSGEKKKKVQKIDAPVKLGGKPKEKETEPVSSIAKEISKDKPKTDGAEEKGKKIVDPRGEGKGKHVKIEGASTKGFIGKVFRRKSG
jgi:large subunit ribosomal protein L22